MTDGDAPGARLRSGPRPGQTASRQKILDVARAAFAANGYDGTSMRGIAREAGVDPSLIVHFFATKAGLFAATVEWPFDAEEVIRQVKDVPPEQLGRVWAESFIANWEQDERRNPVLEMVGAALTDATAAALLREFITVNFAKPLVARGGGDQQPLRAALVAAQLIGFGLARYGIRFEPLQEASLEQAIAILAADIQRCCTGPLPAPVSPAAATFARVRG